MKRLAILTRKIRYFAADLKATMAATNIVSVDVACHRAATSADFPLVVEKLTAIIGRKLTCYIACIKRRARY
jgi:hypothetical protein